MIGFCGPSSRTCEVSPLVASFRTVVADPERHRPRAADDAVRWDAGAPQAPTITHEVGAAAGEDPAAEPSAYPGSASSSSMGWYTVDAYGRSNRG